MAMMSSREGEDDGIGVFSRKRRWKQSSIVRPRLARCACNGRRNDGGAQRQRSPASKERRWLRRKRPCARSRATEDAGEDAEDDGKDDGDDDGVDGDGGA